MAQLIKLKLLLAFDIWLAGLLKQDRLYSMTLGIVKTSRKSIAHPNAVQCFFCVLSGEFSVSNRLIILHQRTLLRPLYVEPIRNLVSGGVQDVLVGV
jgi:hypothetical protein